MMMMRMIATSTQIQIGTLTIDVPFLPRWTHLYAGPVIPSHGGSKQPNLGAEPSSHVIEVQGAVLREQRLPSLVYGHE
jgi:hypothetical protein